MSTYVEHANISVPDVDEAIAFLKVIAPDFKIRKDVRLDVDPPRWVHIGTYDSYIALQAIDPKHNPKVRNRAYFNYGVNHLALVVDDFDAVVTRLKEEGYPEGMGVEVHPFRKRGYFYDRAGFEWEIIEYLSDKPEERNAYDV